MSYFKVSAGFLHLQLGAVIPVIGWLTQDPANRQVPKVYTGKITFYSCSLLGLLFGSIEIQVVKFLLANAARKHG